MNSFFSDDTCNAPLAMKSLNSVHGLELYSSGMQVAVSAVYLLLASGKGYR